MRNSLWQAIKRRIPTRAEIWPVLITTIFITHLWGIVLFLRYVPALLLRLRLSQILITAAYNLLFILFESLVVVAILVLLAVVLPQNWLRKQFAVQASLSIVLLALLNLLFQNSSKIALWLHTIWHNLRSTLGASDQASSYSLLPLITVLIGLGLSAFFLSLPVLPRFSRAARTQKYFERFVEHASMLASLFLGLDVLAVVTVLIRNL